MGIFFGLNKVFQNTKESRKFFLKKLYGNFKLLMEKLDGIGAHPLFMNKLASFNNLEGNIFELNSLLKEYSNAIHIILESLKLEELKGSVYKDVRLMIKEAKVEPSNFLINQNTHDVKIIRADIERIRKIIHKDREKLEIIYKKLIEISNNLDRMYPLPKKEDFKKAA